MSATTRRKQLQEMRPGDPVSYPPVLGGVRMCTRWRGGTHRQSAHCHKRFVALARQPCGRWAGPVSTRQRGRVDGDSGGRDTLVQHSEDVGAGVRHNSYKTPTSARRSLARRVEPSKSKSRRLPELAGCGAIAFYRAASRRRTRREATDEVARPLQHAIGEATSPRRTSTPQHKWMNR